VIVLTTYAEVKDAFRSRLLRQALYDDGDRLMHGVIVNLHGDEHIARRRLENRLFRRDTFAWYERDRIPRIIDDTLREPIAIGRGDLVELARRTMMTLSIDVAGVDVAHERFDELYGLMDQLARASTVAHATGDRAATIERGDEALDAFDEQFFQPSLTRRAELLRRWTQGEIGEDHLPRDVLITLMRNQDRLELGPETMLREVAYFPWVGSHSTSAQLVHAMHHIYERLAAHPDDRDGLTDDDQLRQRFVHESMRLHPASPVAVRIALTDVTLRSGRTIAQGERVVLGIEEANRDPAVFGDGAGLFDPARPLPEDVAPWGLSFGHGTHACLGQELAGGIAPDEALEHHLLGSVALMAGRMLAFGARPDPNDPPVLDTTTTRVVWGRYPVLFAPSP